MMGAVFVQRSQKVDVVTFRKFFPVDFVANGGMGK